MNREDAKRSMKVGCLITLIFGTPMVIVTWLIGKYNCRWLGDLLIGTRVGQTICILWAVAAFIGVAVAAASLVASMEISHQDELARRHRGRKLAIHERKQKQKETRVRPSFNGLAAFVFIAFIALMLSVDRKPSESDAPVVDRDHTYLRGTDNGYAWRRATREQKLALCTNIARSTGEKDCVFFYGALNAFYSSSDPDALKMTIAQVAAGSVIMDDARR